ncbi:MAG: replicative DNA helicase [Oscillospiraceae bacterium]|nr:replicative DNA helicase [Oscillospiraceae bacterium]
MADILSDFGRSQPYNLDAEQSVLGCILIDSELISDVMEKIRTPEVFYVDKHQTLYSTMIRLFSESRPIDYVTLLDEVRGAELFDNEQSARSYLLHLMEVVPTTANLGHYCDIIVEKFYLRRLLGASTEISGMVQGEEGSASQLLDMAEQKIYDIRQGQQSSDLKPISEVIIGVYDNIYQMHSRTDSRYTGLPTGFTGLDAVLSGLNKSDLILIAARPGMGKTTFAMNIAANVGIKHPDVDIAAFSLEMSAPQIVSRMLCADAMITSDKMRTGHLEPEEWGKLAQTAQRLSGTRIYLDDTAGITVSQIKAKARRLKNLGCIIIDYLQLMTSGSKIENRVQEISQITRSLKIMAKELNVPVICLSQLSRAAEQRQGHRPMLSDLRESGSIEQDADIVLFLYRDDYYADEEEEGKENAKKNTALCIVAKNRHGSTGDIPIGFQGEYTRFSNLEMTRDAPPAR